MRGRAAAAAGAALGLASAASAASTASAASPPNFLIILTDDQDVALGSLDYMPQLKREMAQGGMAFPYAFASVPVCCPSRASMWTGRYQHNTRVWNNSVEGNCASAAWVAGPETGTLAALLAAGAGYASYFGGKFLNNYGGAGEPLSHVPPGWTDWQGLRGNSIYYNYEISNNGVPESHGADYGTDYLPELVYNRSLDFIDKHASSGKPLLVALSLPSCHQPADPAPQYSGLYPGVGAPRHPNFNTRVGDTHWFEASEGGGSGPLGKDAITWVDLLYRRRLQTLATVDDIVAGAIAKFAAAGLLENTYIVYTADNGYHLGNAGLALDKRQPWDYDARIPFFVRGPGVAAGSVSAAPVSHVDVVPTLLELAGVAVPPTVDGQSLVPLLHGAGAVARGDALAAAAADASAAAALARHEGDPAHDAAAYGGSDATAASLAAAGWTRQSVYYSYHGENQGMPPVCVNAGITDPALMCYAQNNGSLTVPPYPPAGFQTFCSCQDATNNTYACVRTVNATANFRYCEFQLQPAGAAAEGGAVATTAAPFVEYFDVAADPYEMTNAAGSLAPAVAAALSAQLAAFRTCVGSAACNQY